MKKLMAITGLSLAFAAGSASAQGATISIACGSVGQDFEQCKTATDAWAKKTGNKVKIVQVPQSATERLGLYQQQLGAKSGDVDVYMIDVVWPGLLAQHLVDLKQHIPQAELNKHFPAIVANNTVNGKLVGVPWFTDAGLLYYRKDLLEKYGFKNPPKTWAELEKIAKTIQAGEKKNDPNFTGFVFQGKNYEGLTCDALEWVASHGGGTIVDPTGKVTINNPKAVEALKTARGFVGNISPKAVTTYTEEESRNVFQSGNAAFMRNWPYAYALGQAEDSPIKGKIGVAALPRAEGGKPAACLGGWQLGVNAYSKNQKAAADLVRYLTSEQEQKRRAIEASYNPTISSLYKDQEVLKAAPFMGSLYDVFVAATPRPSTVTKEDYNQVSNAFSTAVYNVLTDAAKPEQALKDLESQLNRIKGRGW